ncbi:MAG: M23 family metallopeptidase [Epsilonproteobacteria bacterium]|nr:M23 family metallopeptidase [Campylobacterota bacterium]
MRLAIAVPLVVSLLGAGSIQLGRWERSQSFLDYLHKSGLPKELYYSLDGEERELVSELRAGALYYTLFDDNGTIEQVLIPINEELQIHIYREQGAYGIALIPIDYTQRAESFWIALEGGPYNAILDATGNVGLAYEFLRAFKGSIDFRRSIYKGDRVAILYDQKYRLGQPFGLPRIKAAMVETRGKRHYVFAFEGRFYDEQGKEMERFRLIRPVRARISSPFTLRRWHPILRRWRAHLGVDFAAPAGTPVRAAGPGRILFAGYKGGYGKVVIIAHRDGYKSLYAHLRSFRKGIRPGRFVGQGEVIGYVGSTGLSTGPHLHFGLYRYNRPINPLRVVRIAKGRLSGAKLRRFKGMVARYKREIEELLAQKPERTRVEKIKLVSYIGEEHGAKRTD